MLEKAGITISGGDPLPRRRTGDEPPKMGCLFSDKFDVSKTFKTRLA